MADTNYSSGDDYIDELFWFSSPMTCDTYFSKRYDGLSARLFGGARRALLDKLALDGRRY